jgi:hypothetical protein
MHVHVEESWQEDFSGAVEGFDPGGWFDRRRDAFDFSFRIHQNVEPPWCGVVGIDGEPAVE